VWGQQHVGLEAAAAATEQQAHVQHALCCCRQLAVDSDLSEAPAGADAAFELCCCLVCALAFLGSPASRPGVQHQVVVAVIQQPGLGCIIQASVGEMNRLLLLLLLLLLVARASCCWPRPPAGSCRMLHCWCLLVLLLLRSCQFLGGLLRTDQLWVSQR
jgi:hypothetical protein